jgi:hypothetical protein
MENNSNLENKIEVQTNKEILTNFAKEISLTFGVAIGLIAGYYSAPYINNIAEKLINYIK